jgi:hypothetical protein
MLDPVPETNAGSGSGNNESGSETQALTMLYCFRDGDKGKLKFSRKTKIFLVYMPTAVHETFMKLHIFPIPRKRQNSKEIIMIHEFGLVLSSVE